MARAKGGLHRLAFAALMQFLQNIITAATGNPIAPTPTPTLAELQGLHDDGATKVNAINAAEDHLSMLRTDLADHRRLIIDGLTTYIAYAEMVTGRDPMELQSLGLPLRNTPSVAQPCATITGLVTATGDDEGVMTANWPAQVQADTYEVHTSADPMTPTSWVFAKTTSESKVRLTELPSGQKRWLRVRAVNRRGEGSWSEPGGRMIP